MNNIGPIFIGGDSRSGTTYLMGVLNRHKDIHISDESNFVTRLLGIYCNRPVPNSKELKETLDYVFSEKKFADWNLEKVKLFKLLSNQLPVSFTDFVWTVLKHDRDLKKRSARLFGIKKGSCIISAWKLREQFPDSKFIHIVRDGRAVYNSKRKAIHSETGAPFCDDPDRSAFEWKRMINLFDQFQNRYPESGLEIRYENLIQNPGPIMNRISSFLGVEGGDAFQEESHPFRIPRGRRHLHPNVNKGPIVSRIDAWQTELQEGEIQRFEIIAGAELEKKGYRLFSRSVPIR